MKKEQFTISPEEALEIEKAKEEMEGRNHTFVDKINYGYPIEKLIKENGENYAIKEDYMNFEVSEGDKNDLDQGIKQIEYKLFNFETKDEGNLESDEVIKKFKKTDYRPATLKELIYFGKRHSNILRGNKVVGLGSIRQANHYNDNGVAKLTGEKTRQNFTEIKLDFSYYSHGFKNDDLFLGVRELSSIKSTKDQLSEEGAHDYANLVKAALKESGLKESEITPEDYDKATQIVEKMIEAAENESDVEDFTRRWLSLVPISLFFIPSIPIMVIELLIKEYLMKLHDKNWDQKKLNSTVEEFFHEIEKRMVGDKQKLALLKEEAKHIND